MGGRDLEQTIDELWDFNDPAASEARFRNAAVRVDDEAERIRLKTQIARALGLQGRFDEAHGVLDEVQSALDTPDDAMLLLERGRLHNSAGDVESARPFFHKAWDRARALQHDALAVDAAHMIAIVAIGDEALEWNARALELAESSADPRAQRWRGSLHNNLGWTRHERGELSAALSHFEQALDARKAQGDEREVLIARWCIARCLRSLGRVDEAFAEQERLQEAWQQRGEADGYVHEELAACLRALGRNDEAEAHDARAQELLTSNG